MVKKRKIVIILLLTAVLIAVIPLFMLKGAKFSGSDDAASKVVSEITKTDYKPWAKPVMETWIGGKLPGEVESLIFCIQTGIGSAVIFFFLGRFVERTKKENKDNKKNKDNKTD